MIALHHGGPDALGVPRWDFSTNANSFGPAPTALAAVRDADATRYPDPQYAALRESLAALHCVSPSRIVVCAGASEFIVRITAAVAQRWPDARVHVPIPGYTDYARAAQAHQLPLVPTPEGAHLVWHTEPGSPHGEATACPTVPEGAVLVVDRAYAPLRLSGDAPAIPPHAWQLWSPNKALGLTGVRAAYAVAPEGAQPWLAALQALAPSWPLGAHGVAMLSAWTQPGTQQWLRASLPALVEWKRQQLGLCLRLGWHCRASVTPFYVARWDGALGATALLLPHLRAHGVKLRDTESLGLPGWVRVSVQPPEAQQALLAAWQNAISSRPGATA